MEARGWRLLLRREKQKIDSHTGSHPSGTGSGAVDSVFGRTGDVTAVAGDYISFYAGTGHGHVEADITDLSHPVDSVFTRTGAVTAQFSDYGSFFSATAHAAAHALGGTDSAASYFAATPITSTPATLYGNMVFANTPASQQVQAPSGALATPGLSFAGDPNTGITPVPGADILAVVTGGAARSYFSSTGVQLVPDVNVNSSKMGIGTTPAQLINGLLIVSGANDNGMRVTNTMANATVKYSRVQAVHYTTAEEGITLIGGTFSSGVNNITWGWGFSAENSATAHRFGTGATITTLSGTERMAIESTGTIIVNDDGVSTADFRIEGDTNANLFFLDASADCIGINNAAPSGGPVKLDITGNIRYRGTQTTGGGSAALGTNCPAATAGAPYTWFAMSSSDGSSVYIPVWK